MRFQRRLRLLYVLFCVALGIIWLRAGQLQALDGEAWADAARAMRQTDDPLQARRGAILSADGQILAEDTHVFQLAIVPWEWQRRGRARCTGCGAMYYERGTKRIYIPKTCACARYAKRGGSGALKKDAYPRVGKDQVPPGTLERLPDGDVSALEKALEMKPGALAERVEKRVAEVERLVADLKEALEQSGDTSAFLATRLRQRKEDLLKRRFLVTGRVPPETARLVITDEDGRYRGLRVVSALRRHYPQGDFAPHLIGWTSKIRDWDELERLRTAYGEERFTPDDRWGRRGLEKTYNAQLHGVPGLQRKELDTHGRFTRIVQARPPRPGRTLHLSIDVGVSREAEKILERIARPREDGAGRYFPGGKPSAAFVLMDAHTGELLLWAETPRFDPNKDLGDLFLPDCLQPIADAADPDVWRPRGPLDQPLDREAWLDQIIVPVPITMSRIGQVAVEPGSTLKTLVGLAMLHSGRHLPLEGYVCAGGTNPGCHHCGSVDLRRALCKSCNRYFAFSVRDSEHWPIYRRVVGQTMHDFGLGQAPTSECGEWVDGQWLWPWYDFSLKDAMAEAQVILAAEHGDAAPKLALSLSPRTPATVGGDMPRLARKIADLAAWTAKRTGSRDLQLSIHQERRVGAEVTLRFGVRAPGRTGWFALPGSVSQPRLPRSIARMRTSTRGVAGDLARGGTAWFEITFPRRVGTKDPGGAPVVQPGDGRAVAIGQGPVLTTPLHMVRAMAVLANGGTLLEPHAVRAVGTRRTQFAGRRLPYSDHHINRIRDGMYDAVNMPGGTANRHPRWEEVPATVYGKTGTAQVGKSWRPLKDDPVGEPWHHWFVGFAEAPGRRTVAFACVLHSRTEAASGMTAAPATQEILSAWYASPRSREVGAGGR